MSLERKDVRAKLDDEWHTALVKVCQRDGLDHGEFIEREIVRVLSQRIHDFILDEEAFHDLGITGKIREKPGIGKAGRR